MSRHTTIIDGLLQTERQHDGTRRLLRPLVVGVAGHRITVAENFRTDFSSIPWPGRLLVRWSRVDVAGVVHDWLYARQTLSRTQADRIWRLVAVAGEHHANAFQAWVGWSVLRAVGWLFWPRRPAS